jgi:hypothetical protein
MFNAAVINLETGVQEVGETADYQSLEEGMRVMEELALKLSGQEERAAQISAAAQAEAKAKAEAEAKGRAQAEAKAKAEAEARLIADAKTGQLSVSDAASFAQAVAAINNDRTGGAYTIVLKGSFAANPVEFTNNAAKTITLKGDGAVRTIRNNGNEQLLSVLKGVTLVLDSGITLDGNNKEAHLVYVSEGTFIMKAGSTVRDAKTSGVLVGGDGTFTMEGGNINRNTATYGGGVFVWNGTFTMKGGEISGNLATYGGGVYVGWRGTFTMEGGTISRNTASAWGGGVFVESSGTFIKRGRSTIDASNSAPKGKVVYVSDGKKRNSAAGPDVNMNSRVSGKAGGWE